jgi:hypothetical protein
MSSVSNTTITSHSADRSGGAGRTSTPAGNTGAGSTGAPNNRDGRNRRRNKQNRSEDNSAGNNGAGNNGDATKPKATFKGDEPGMNGHVFGCYDEQTNKRQYLLTMSALKQFTMKTYKFAHDLESLFRPTPSNPVIPRPAKPVARAGVTVDEVDMLIFNERIKEHVTRLSRLDSNLAAIWSVTYGQCTRAMRDKLDAIPEFEDKYKDKDCLWLFASIRGINMKFDQTRYAHLALLEAFQGLLTIKQTPGQTVNDAHLTNAQQPPRLSCLHFCSFAAPTSLAMGLSSAISQTNTRMAATSILKTSPPPPACLSTIRRRWIADQTNPRTRSPHPNRTPTALTPLLLLFLRLLPPLPLHSHMPMAQLTPPRHP